MKNKIAIICFVTSLFICFSYTSSYKKVAGAHPGSTGAPNDLTCAQTGCHTDAQVITNAVNNNTLIFSSLDSSYLPNQPYTITVQVQGTGINPITRFGFELQPIKDADSTNVGQLTVTNSTRTKIINHTLGTDVRFSMTHKTASTPALSSNYNEWIFNWTSPPTNVGTITFYYATNCTNNNGQSSGDRIYLHKFKIKPAFGVSVKEYADAYNITTFYKSDERTIELSYKLSTQTAVKITLFDNLGREVVRLPNTTKPQGQQTEKISIADHIKSGVYFMHVQINNNTISKKIIIQ